MDFFLEIDVGPLRGFEFVVHLGLNLVVIGGNLPCNECDEYC